jgi:hypothetical protein
MDGVGLALMPEFGITATDFDHCVDADGNVPREIEEIAARTYTEYSPSGAGVQAFSVGNFGDRKAPATGDTYGFEDLRQPGLRHIHRQRPADLRSSSAKEDTVADDPTINSIIQNLCDARFGPKRVDEVEDDFMAGYEPRLGLSQPTMEAILSTLAPTSAATSGSGSAWPCTTSARATTPASTCGTRGLPTGRPTPEPKACGSSGRALTGVPARPGSR